MKETQDVNLTHSSKVRMAETVMGKLAALSEKVEDVKKTRGKWVTSIIEYEEEEFDSVSKNKSKDTLLSESVADSEGYEDKADDSVLKNDEAVRKAESLLAEVVTPQGQSGNTPDEVQWSAFKLQANLAPVLLDTGASHLEVMKFTEAVETYIVLG